MLPARGLVRLSRVSGRLLAGGGCRGRQFHATSAVRMRNDEEHTEKAQLQEIKTTALDSAEYFEAAREKNRETFKNALDLFTKRDKRRRGAVEFIYAAMKNMKPFGVHRDLETYRALFDVFPKGKYPPLNMWQAGFGHYPKQNDCAMKLLEQMHMNSVQVDLELGTLLENIFGQDSKAYKKYMRMVYWQPKFKNLSPFPLPFHLPKEALELAKLAIKQITSVDRTTAVTVYNCEEIDESVDKTWIVSGQSPEQREMIKHLPKTKALYVEGAFRLWLQNVQVNYFILRGEPVPRPPPHTGDSDDVTKIKNWTLGEFDEFDLAKIPNIHEQEDGTILGCCATGTSSKDSLLSWVRFLQRENPDLEHVPILFTLTSPLGPVLAIGDEGEKKELV